MTMFSFSHLHKSLNSYFPLTELNGNSALRYRFSEIHCITVSPYFRYIKIHKPQLHYTLSIIHMKRIPFMEWSTLSTYDLITEISLLLFKWNLSQFMEKVSFKFEFIILNKRRVGYANRKWEDLYAPNKWTKIQFAKLSL